MLPTAERGKSLKELSSARHWGRQEHCTCAEVEKVHPQPSSALPVNQLAHVQDVKGSIVEVFAQMSAFIDPGAKSSALLTRKSTLLWRQIMKSRAARLVRSSNAGQVSTLVKFMGIPTS